MAKPEANYIKRVHNQLNNSVYTQGMGLTATNGTPDNYYEGHNGILWVEYKYVQTPPRTLNLSTSTHPKLSKLQLRWLHRAAKNNVKTAVIMGTDSGGYIFTVEDLKKDIVLKDVGMSPRQVAEWIEVMVLG